MKIFIANNPTEAHIVSELLNQHKIHVEVRGEGMFSLRGELPMTEDTAPYIWLFEQDKAIVAQKIVEEYRHSTHNTEVWLCDGCQNENEGQFAICWSCGKSAPN